MRIIIEPLVPICISAGIDDNIKRVLSSDILQLIKAVFKSCIICLDVLSLDLFSSASSINYISRKYTEHYTAMLVS